jgi:hypothetical protein
LKQKGSRARRAAIRVIDSKQRKIGQRSAVGIGRRQGPGRVEYSSACRARREKKCYDCQAESQASPHERGALAAQALPSEHCSVERHLSGYDRVKGHSSHWARSLSAPHPKVSGICQLRQDANSGRQRLKRFGGRCQVGNYPKPPNSSDVGWLVDVAGLTLDSGV